jgi:hypothetical protein
MDPKTIWHYNKYIGLQEKWLKQIKEIHSAINWDNNLKIDWKLYEGIASKLTLSSTLAGFERTLMAIRRNLKLGQTIFGKVDQRFIYDLLPLIGLFFKRPIEGTLIYLSNYIKFAYSSDIARDIVESFYEKNGNVKNPESNEFSRLYDINAGNPYINTYRDKYT